MPEIKELIEALTSIANNEKFVLESRVEASLIASKIEQNPNWLWEIRREK